MQDLLAAAALPYQDPPIKTILILSSFLLLLNVINHVLDRLIYCGLIGQILVGIAFGTPGAKWLDKSTEQVIVQLGYLGLIFLVFEGGLNTNFKSLKANIGISGLVAVTGIGLPIAFAFCLRSLASATPLQAFAAGAALCSSSLGTTFSILSSSGLTNTRLGTVLTSVAMMDDLVGLVLVQVISKLGSRPSSFHAITVVRPIAVSIGLALTVLLACLYLVKPFSSSISVPKSSAVMRAIRKQPDEANLIAYITLLFGVVTAASFAGTSNLFAAYLAGASISWYDSEVAQLDEAEKNEHDQETQSLGTRSVQQAAHSEGNFMQVEHLDDTDNSRQRRTARHTWDGCYSGSPRARGTEARNKADARLSEGSFDLQEASIGFSIPVTCMFSGAVVWRGIVFTILMLVGKLVTGLWLIRIEAPTAMATKIKAPTNHLTVPKWNCSGSSRSANRSNSGNVNTADESRSKAMANVGIAATTDGEPGPRQPNDKPSQGDLSSHLSSTVHKTSQASASTTKSRSLYAATIVGTAMMARGEIGFLIAALAESTGIFDSPNGTVSPDDSGSRIYLAAIWAIVLCTVIGPVSVGLLVRRVKKLQQQRREQGGGEDPLGIWGVL